MSESDRDEIVAEYRGQVRHYRGLQRVPDSGWTDSTVTRRLAPHRVDATERLYELGVTREQAARLLDRAERTPPVRTGPRTVSEFINGLIRGGGQ